MKQLILDLAWAPLPPFAGFLPGENAAVVAQLRKAVEQLAGPQRRRTGGGGEGRTLTSSPLPLRREPSPEGCGVDGRADEYRTLEGRSSHSSWKSSEDSAASLMSSTAAVTDPDTLMTASVSASMLDTASVRGVITSRGALPISEVAVTWNGSPSAAAGRAVATGGGVSEPKVLLP